jgi:hypothetical protein
MRGRTAVLVLCAALLSSLGGFLLNASAAEAPGDGPDEHLLPSMGGRVWSGPDSLMSLYALAAYCAPVLWFSPDEPLFWNLTTRYIAIPVNLPFEEAADSAVVYYRAIEVLERHGSEGPTFVSAADKDDYMLNLNRIRHIHLQFIFYYPDEVGMGSHAHDLEMADFSIQVRHEDGLNVLEVSQVLGRAHGVIWYFNTLEVTGDTVFPVTILVEEGKHASCPDRNGDGYYSPGYDVNQRVNDAWGVRDVLRTGTTFTAKYQSWMTKVRPVEARIVPPLPYDSPLYPHFKNHYRFRNHEFTQYQLRPFPEWSEISYEGIEHADFLESIIEDKKYPVWPNHVENTEFKKLGRTLYDDVFSRSYGLGYRYDGYSKVYLTFPLLILRNVEAPVIGGWFAWTVDVNTGTFTGDFRRFSQRLMYTPSASRWLDSYLAAGYEYQRNVEADTSYNKTDFVFELGLKIRGNIAKTPMGFLKHLGTDFWGIRVGVRAYGFSDFTTMRFIGEIGTGAF